jgi:hypothetical protein
METLLYLLYVHLGSGITGLAPLAIHKNISGQGCPGGVASSLHCPAFFQHLLVYLRNVYFREHRQGDRHLGLCCLLFGHICFCWNTNVRLIFFQEKYLEKIKKKITIKNKMILESIAARKVMKNTSIGNDGYDSNSLSNTGIAAEIMIVMIIIFVWVFLIVVAVYSAYQCNKNNTGWLIINILVAVFFPMIYLLVHPNLMLAHEGSKAYCDSY